MSINDYTFEEPKPFGKLSIIAMKGCEENSCKNRLLLKAWRQDKDGVIYSNWL